MTQNDTTLRSDRASNQALITEALASFKNTNKRLPTQEELAERTGLSRTTIQRRLRDIDFGEAVAPLRLYLQDVLLTITEKALAGDMRAAKLFLQVSYGWTEKDPSKLLTDKPKYDVPYTALFEGKKIEELSRTELDELGPLIHEGRVTLVDKIIIDVNDPRYQKEIHEQFRVSLEESLDNGELQNTLAEMGYSLEPVKTVERVIVAFEAVSESETNAFKPKEEQTV